MIIQHLGDIALYSIIPACLGFCLFYGLRSKWWLNQAGKAVFYLALSLLAVLGLVAAAAIFGDYEWRPWARFGVFLAVSVAMWRIFITVLVIQYRERQKVRRAVAGR